MRGSATPTGTTFAEIRYFDERLGDAWMLQDCCSGGISNDRQLVQSLCIRLVVSFDSWIDEPF
jgi:hypothetical protein